MPTLVLGPGDVLVKVHAVSVNHTLDLQVRQGGGNYGMEMPLVLGNDPSGVVVEVDSGVEHPKINDRVTIFRWANCGACAQCVVGNSLQCASPRMIGV